MQINPLSTHSNAFAYLRYKFPQMVDSFADIPVVELTHKEWDEFNLTGYGYLVREEDISNIISQLPNYSEDMLNQLRSMHPEVNRDLYIHSIYKKLSTVPFFLILEGNEAAIIHEVAHIVWSRLTPEEQSGIDLPEVSAPDNDQYLQSDHERFTHMTEMEYFKSQGMSFDDYFRLHNTKEYQLINDPNADPHMKELAQMDYNDYQQIWNHSKTSSSKSWMTKLAQAFSITTGTHDKSGRPIFILQGDTYSIKGQLGRKGLGFNYWRPVGWWMYQDRMSSRVSSGLQTLGFDVSALSGASPAPGAPVAPGAPPVSQRGVEPVEPATAAPVAPTSVTDQSWEETEPKSKWYGFPIKKPIYETMLTVAVEGQELEVKASLGRWFNKGRRRVPSYIYEVYWNDEVVGRFGKKAPSDWGTYDEAEVAGAVPEIIQGRFAQGEKSKMYGNLKYRLQLSGRDQELTDYLAQFSEYTGRGDRQTIEKTIHLDEIGYEGDYPIKFFTYEGTSWYGETALEHPNAPRPDTIFYLRGIPPTVHTIDEFHQWLEGSINDPEVMDRAKEGYLKYLKSFHFSEAEQEEARGQFQEILPIVESKVTDPNFFRQKLMEHGYIRPHRRRRQNAPGMQPQDQIKLILDQRKIVDDSYSWDKISRSPNYFYSVIAYLMHRQKAGNIGFGAGYGQIGSSIRTFYDTLKRYGATIDIGELYEYIESLASKLLREVIEVQPASSARDNYQQFYGGGMGEGQLPDSASAGQEGLEFFVNFATRQGLDPDTVRANPTKAFRELSKRFHPDLNQDSEESNRIFRELGDAWSLVSDDIKKMSESWLYRVCYG